MKKNIFAVLVIAVTAIASYSCKLDPVIYPSKQTATGAKSINNPDLSGTYYLLSDYSEYFDTKTDSPYSSTKKYPALFKRVILNDSLKTAMVTFYPDSTFNFTYQLTSQNNKTYITFNNDILPRSANNKIEITSLGSNVMQWMAADPAIFNYGSGEAYTAYAVTFTKE